jgi:hypothetical protein
MLLVHQWGVATRATIAALVSLITILNPSYFGIRITTGKYIRVKSCYIVAVVLYMYIRLHGEPTKIHRVKARLKNSLMKTTITMKRDKECKGSVRFATADEKAHVTNKQPFNLKSVYARSHQSSAGEPQRSDHAEHERR